MTEQPIPTSDQQRISELESALQAERARRERLERVLAAHHRLSELEPELAIDALLQQLLAQGAVRVNGRPATKPAAKATAKPKAKKATNKKAAPKAKTGAVKASGKDA